MISHTTKEWLRHVGQLGERAKAEAAEPGADAADIVKRYSHESVENDADFEKICTELGLNVPAIWSEKQSQRFASEIEAQRFAKTVIAEMVEGVQ